MTQFEKSAIELHEEREPVEVPYKWDRTPIAKAQYLCPCGRGFLSISIKLLHQQKCKEVVCNSESRLKA